MRQSLVTMSDAAVVIRRIRRRAAARRLALLVQSGAVVPADYRVIFDGEADVVVDAALRLALRARELSRPMGARTSRVRGIIELNPDTEHWAARAGSVCSEGFEFTDAALAIQWLEQAVDAFVTSNDFEHDYCLQIGIVEGQLTCSSALPHDEAGFCEVCWAVEQAWREEPYPRKGLDEVAVDGSMMGTRGVAG